MSDELITFNRMEFDRWWKHNTRPMLMGAFDEPPAEVEDPRIALLTDALKNMCDCASAFAGRESIPAAEFMEKAGPVVANAAKVLGEVSDEPPSDDERTIADGSILG